MELLQWHKVFEIGGEELHRPPVVALKSYVCVTLFNVLHAQRTILSECGECLQWSCSIAEALLGGFYAPCSLRHFTPFSLLPSIFQRTLLFTNFHWSFFISPCSLLLFTFYPCSLIISLAPCSISQFFTAPCSIFQICVLPAPRLRFPCSLPPSLF